MGSTTKAQCTTPSKLVEYLDATQLHLKNVLLDGHPLWLAKRIEAWSAEEVSLYNEVDEIMNGLLRLQPGGGS